MIIEIVAALVAVVYGTAYYYKQKLRNKIADDDKQRADAAVAQVVAANKLDGSLATVQEDTRDAVVSAQSADYNNGVHLE